MIIGSYVRMTIGERRTGLLDAQRNLHPEQPFVVLRAATAAEWLEECAANGCRDNHARTLAADPTALFYDVSVD